MSAGYGASNTRRELMTMYVHGKTFAGKTMALDGQAGSAVRYYFSGHRPDTQV